MISRSKNGNDKDDNDDDDDDTAMMMILQIDSAKVISRAILKSFQAVLYGAIFARIYRALQERNYHAFVPLLLLTFSITRSSHGSVG